MLRILDRVEQQIEAVRLPLVAVTVAAVPCPDTPVIVTLHWHGLVRERLTETAAVEAVAYATVPSSALQLNDRWSRLLELDVAALEAAWAAVAGANSLQFKVEFMDTLPERILPKNLRFSSVFTDPSKT